MVGRPVPVHGDILQAHRCQDNFHYLYASTFFKGTARAWYTAWHKQYQNQALQAGAAERRSSNGEQTILPIQTELGTYEDRSKKQPPNFEEVILRKFTNLAQTGTVHECTNQFTDTLLQIPLSFRQDRTYLLYHYIDGLKPEIRRHVY